MFILIFKAAFGLEAAYGSVIYALMYGIRRALFATEAGLGSATNVSASAVVKHPAKQGFLGMLGVFIVAFLTCTATAFIVLVSGIYEPGNGLQGIALVQQSLIVHIGNFGDDLLAFIIFLLAFSTIIGNYSYAENNLEYLTQNDNYTKIVRVVTMLFVFMGSIANIQVIWNLGDMFMAALALINITAILFLTPVAVAVIQDYKIQIKNGIKEPVFKKENIPALLQQDKKNIW